MLNTPDRVQKINDKVVTITKASMNTNGDLTGFDVAIEERDIGLALILWLISMIGIIASYSMDLFMFFVLFWALFYATARVLLDYFNTKSLY